MFSDPRAVEGPVKERLGPSFSRPPTPPGSEYQEVLKRDMQKDVQTISKSNIRSATKIQKKTVGNAQTPTDICSGVSRGRSAAEVNSAKTPAVQSPSAPTTKEKKHIVGPRKKILHALAAAKAKK